MPAPRAADGVNEPEASAARRELGRLRRDVELGVSVPDLDPDDVLPRFDGERDGVAAMADGVGDELAHGESQVLTPLVVERVLAQVDRVSPGYGDNGGVGHDLHHCY